MYSVCSSLMLQGRAGSTRASGPANSASNSPACSALMPATAAALSPGRSFLQPLPFIEQGSDQGKRVMFALRGLVVRPTMAQCSRPCES